MAKSKIKLHMPIQLGYWILQLAKLKIIEFYYDFMDTYIIVIMTIITSDMRSIMKPAMLNKYERGLKGFCDVDEGESDSVYHWFPSECCIVHNILDKRTPVWKKIYFRSRSKLCMRDIFSR